MMAVWRRKPDGEVIVHSDQGSHYGSDDWQRFCRANNTAPSMSRRGNCWDNAVAESFFSSLKKNASGSGYIKPGTWPGRIFSITLKCSTTVTDATATSVASVRGLRTGLVVRTETFYRSVVTPHNGSEVSRLSAAIHTFATRHISRGANLFWLASHMGHKVLNCFSGIMVVILRSMIIAPPIPR